MDEQQFQQMFSNQMEKKPDQYDLSHSQDMMRSVRVVNFQSQKKYSMDDSSKKRGTDAQEKIPIPTTVLAGLARNSNVSNRNDIIDMEIDIDNQDADEDVEDNMNNQVKLEHCDLIQLDNDSVKDAPPDTHLSLNDQAKAKKYEDYSLEGRGPSALL